jgi:hypothetical protein
MAISKISLAAVLGLVVAFGAAAQQSDSPANDAPLAKDQANTPDTAKKRQQDEARPRQDLSRDPDRATIGPRTTQGLAQEAISRSNSR